MKYSIINLNNIKKQIGFRLDSEYWHPENINIINSIKQKGAVPLKDYIDEGYRVVYENTKILPSEFGKKNNLPKFVQATDIESPIINIENIGYVCNDDWERYPKGRIKEGEILLEVKGNVKKVAIVPTDFSEKTLVSGTLYKFSTNNKINKFFLLLFLISDYGQKLKNRLVSNIATPFINKDELYDIPIPTLSIDFQFKMELFYKRIFLLKKESKVLYSQAEQLLLSELDLLNHRPKHKLAFIKTFSDTKETGRMDAEYFQPKYEEIIRAVESYKNGFDMIGNQFKQNKKNFKKITDKEYNYIEISSINISDGSMLPTILKGEELPANAKIKLYKNDIVISKVRPYRGAIGIVNNDDYVGSGAFVVLQEKMEINKETLFVFLRLKPMLSYSLKFNTGTSYPVIIDGDVLNFPIPLFEENIQNIVKENISKSYKLRYQSKQLLEIAKKGVETAIEQTEQHAQKWINEEIGKLGVRL